MPKKGRVGQFADLRGMGGWGVGTKERGGGFIGGVDTLMHTMVPITYTYIN